MLRNDFTIIHALTYISGLLFKAAKVLPIQQRVNIRTAIMVFKARNQLVPEYISDLFQLKSSVTITESPEVLRIMICGYQGINWQSDERHYHTVVQHFTIVYHLR